MSLSIGKSIRKGWKVAVIAVIFAGGSGTRMKTSGLPKQFLELYGKPIIVYTLEQFQCHALVDAVVVSCIESHVDYLHALVERFHLTKVRKIVVGGRTGQQSIYNGLVAAEKLFGRKEDIVLIHDGVRPLIDQETITKNIEIVRKNGSCVTCVPVIETVVIKKGNDGQFEVPCRKDSFLARAPQSFYLSEILSLHRRAIDDKLDTFTDSCSLAHYYGYSLSTTEGKLENIKITTPTDFYVFRAILDARENSKIFGLS